MADRRLQVFHAVAKNLSFTKAAEALFMTQPAVTFQIRQLEEQFNSRLFDRAHGRIALTPAGQLALEYAERILALSAELDLGYPIVSNPPYGIAGPKGMDPAVVKVLHDAFKKALDDPEYLKMKTLEKFDQDVFDLNSADYAVLAKKSIEEERDAVKRLNVKM